MNESDAGPSVQAVPSSGGASDPPGGSSVASSTQTDAQELGAGKPNRDRDREKAEDRAQRDRERAVEKREKAEEKRRKQRETSERELLGWIRMGLTLVSTGLGAERALTYVDRLNPTGRIDPMHLLRALALALMLLGMFAMIAACVKHLQVGRRLRRGEAAPEPRFSLALVVAVGLLTIFFLALAVVIAVRDDLTTAAHAFEVLIALGGAPPCPPEGPFAYSAGA